MSWYSPAHTAAAGSLVALLDSYMAGAWSLYDTPASNKRVYECDDDPCLFYLYVDDTNSAYAVVELWEGWDAVNHVGTGRKRTEFTSTYGMRIYKETTTLYISVKDGSMRFVSGSSWKGTFIGRPGSLVDETKNVVIFIGSSSGSGVYNQIGYNGAWGSPGGWVSLFDHFDQAVLVTAGQGHSGSSAYTLGGYFKSLGSDGVVYFTELTLSPYHGVTGSGHIIGTLSGVGFLEYAANANAKFTNGDTLTVGSDTWLVFGGTDSSYRYFTAFKED